MPNLNENRWARLFVVLSTILLTCFVLPNFLGASQSPETLPPEIDEISLKQREMRDTIVMVGTNYGSGSGTVISQDVTDEDGVFEYKVVTNAHVTSSRLVTIINDVDFITGKMSISTVDTGCSVISFGHNDNSYMTYIAEVLVENFPYDVAVLSFLAEEELAVANVATDEMLEDIRVFDDVYAVGCQLGMSPMPTVGIVSKILTGDNGDKEWIIYSNTAQIIYGSSGGGLFREYGDHYYLIGIPFRASVAYNGQIVPHLAQAISILTAREFIDQSMVTCQ